MKKWKLVAGFEIFVFTYGAMLLGLCGGLTILDGANGWLNVGIITSVATMISASLGLYETIHDEYMREENESND